MKPVYQTKYHPEGNCLQACLASIFDLDLEDVPEFGVGDDWYEKFREWCLEKFGLQPVDIVADGSFEPRGWHLIHGKSPRGDWNHAIVGYDGAGRHDPHLKGNGVLKTRESYTVFIKVIR